MLQRKSRRRLLYPAGLISLSFLPFLFFAFYQQYLQKGPQHTLEVTYWDPTDTVFFDMFNHGRRDFAKFPMKYVNERFTKITLTGSIEDKIKLDYARVAMRELLQQKDTTLGIEFTFKNKAKYSSLVRLYDLCQREGARSYLNYQDKFWIFNLFPKVDSGMGFCTTGFNMITTYQTKLPYINAIFSRQPTLSGLSLILFITLICLSGYKLIRLTHDSL